MNIEAIFYDLPSGEEPAKELIKSLPPAWAPKTQKTPKRELQRAKDYRKEYLSRRK